MNPPTEIVVHSRIPPHARAASALLGRLFAFAGGIAIGIVVTLAQISGAVVAEIFLQILLLVLRLNVLVKIFGWGCILIGALFQHQDPSELHKNLFIVVAARLYPQLQLHSRFAARDRRYVADILSYATLKTRAGLAVSELMLLSWKRL
jgi:hypothetical protein